jgi:hypothetical protein
METGEVFAYDSTVGQFTPLTRGDDGAAKAPPSIDRNTPALVRGDPSGVAGAI